MLCKDTQEKKKKKKKFTSFVCSFHVMNYRLCIIDNMQYVNLANHYPKKIGSGRSLPKKIGNVVMIMVRQ